MGGQLSYVLSQMLVLVALARFGGVEATGAFGVAMAIATPVFLLANMGLRTGLATDARRAHAFSTYTGLATVTGVLGVAFCVAFGTRILQTEVNGTLLAIIALQKWVESLCNVCYGAFQLRNRMNRVAVSLTLRGWTSAILFTGLLAAGVPVAEAFIAQLVVWILVLVFHDYPNASRLLDGRIALPQFRRRPMGALVIENLPLSLSGFVNALANSLPRLVLDRVYGLEAVGIFTVIAYVLQAGTMVVNAVNQALLGRFAALRLQQTSLPQIRAITRRLLLVAAGLSVLGVAVVAIFGKTALALGFGPAFAAGAPTLVLIALALSTKLFGIVPQALIHADRRFGLFLIYEALSLALGFTLLVVLVPDYGLIGAGLSILIVAVARLGFLWAAAAPALSGRRS